jgi:hypothetical protein
MVSVFPFTLSFWWSVRLSSLHFVKQSRGEPTDANLFDAVAIAITFDSILRSRVRHGIKAETADAVFVAVALNSMRITAMQMKA